jgi:hypothetical protein
MSELTEYRPQGQRPTAREQEPQPDFRPLISPVNHNDDAAYLNLMGQALNAFLAGNMPRTDASLVVSTATKMSRERQHVDERVSKLIEHAPQARVSQST